MIALAVAVSATTGVGLASASIPVQRQQQLLNRGCDAAAMSIQKVLNEAAATPTITIETQVRVLRPGKLVGDIVFKRSGSSISIAADPTTAGSVLFGCGDGFVDSGTNSAESSVGPELPTHHVVSIARKTLTKPGRYTLTFTINQAGQRILAALRARERAYRQRHPHGHEPPSITWGVGLRYRSDG